MKQQQEAAKVIYNAHALLTDLKICSRSRDLEWGKRIHAKAVESRNGSNLYVQTALIKMYAKCGSMVHARRVFDSIQEPDVVSWTALLLGYAENREGHIVLDLLSRMTCAPDTLTYVAAIRACTSLAVNGDARGKGECLERGKEIHSKIGCHLDQYVQNALIDMYAKCGSVDRARHVFDSMRKPDVVSWNTLLLGFAENGKGSAALELFSRMKVLGCVPNSLTYTAVLKACISLAVNGDGRVKADCLRRGREIHADVGCHLDRYLQNTLITLYSKCSSMVDARLVFNNMQKPDVVSWNALIFGYAENREGFTALELYSRMKASGCPPNSVTCVAALKACTSVALTGDASAHLRRGREIHSDVGAHLNHYIQSALIDMYAKCSSMVEARQVFDTTQNPDLVSWNALLLGYTENGEGHVTLHLFSRMKARGYVPNSITYAAALKACASLAENGDGNERRGCLERGREIHSEIGSRLDRRLQSALVDMYAKCGSMCDARRVFDTIKHPDVVAWSALLLGYADNGDGFTALELFSRMKASGCAPDSVTYIALLKSCGLIGSLARGRKLHSEMNEFTARIVTCLVDFYAKCGSMAEAREVFDLHSSVRAVPTWNALLAGYSSFGDTGTVFNLFQAMQDKGYRPDGVTFVCMLLCCSHAGLVDRAREYLEAMPVRYGLTPKLMHFNCMIDALGRSNRLNEAVAVLRQMSCSPDAVTWTTLLAACRKWKNVEIGRLAFQSLVEMDKDEASAYVLMAQIYGTRNMREDQERVEVPGQARVMDEVGRMVRFAVGELDPPEVRDKVVQLFGGMRGSDDVPEGKEAELGCGHSEQRAVAYGILKTPASEPVRVFKNMRTCDDCHERIKTVSKRLGRVIMIRDTSRFHVIVNGNCSCGNDW